MAEKIEDRARLPAERTVITGRPRRPRVGRND